MKVEIPRYAHVDVAVDFLLGYLSANHKSAMLEVADILGSREDDDCRRLSAHITALLTAFAVEQATFPHRPARGSASPE